MPKPEREKDSEKCSMMPVRGVLVSPLMESPSALIISVLSLRSTASRLKLAPPGYLLPPFFFVSLNVSHFELNFVQV